jgi:hypothetical protein
MDMNIDMGTDTNTGMDMDIPRSEIWNQEKFNRISVIKMDSVSYSPASRVPLSGPVRYRSSWVSDWEPIHGEGEVSEKGDMNGGGGGAGRRMKREEEESITTYEYK